MPTFYVRHMQTPSFSDRHAMKLYAAHPSQWPVVAKVIANDVEHAYAVTQHTDDDWTNGPAVMELPLGHEQRSTSVGDVIEMGEFAWVVANMGCKLIPSPQPA